MSWMTLTGRSSSRVWFTAKCWPNCPKAAGLNIDYFPTNFVVSGGQLWYVDYECNDYMDRWSFENWGIRYWSRTPEFLEYLQGREA